MAGWFGGVGTQTGPHAVPGMPGSCVIGGRRQVELDSPTAVHAIRSDMLKVSLSTRRCGFLQLGSEFPRDLPQSLFERLCLG